MIAFFRKIRQKLLTESRVTRYLAYAIGEIILVTIGILIALSINTWNENRKKIERERELMISLKKELSLNSALLDSALNVNKKYGIYADQLVEKLEKDSLYYSIGEITAAFDYYPSYFHAPVLSEIVSKNSEILVTHRGFIDDFRRLLQDYEGIKKAETFLDELWSSRITDFIVDSGIPFDPEVDFLTRKIMLSDFTNSSFSKDQLISLIRLKSTLLLTREFQAQKSLQSTRDLEEKLSNLK
ncbi:hypothetical protein Aoki45_21380 [Algoriphagus sp. oki45]|uniref:DUF6090 family protein n=1 Tax=Algoriphagus sp. oki45 TaxID=3067294 RepID=UPI0027EA66AF|nr:hypothetical protein Aoki45_21380 [Algoriphagus sp. oki45]